MGTLKYKNYIGSVEYDAEGNCLFGKVLGMGSVCITYEGNSVDELKTDFEGAVDFYLQCCKDRNEIPQKPYNGRFLLRMPSELHYKVATTASSLGETINDFINQALSKAVDSFATSN